MSQAQTQTEQTTQTTTPRRRRLSPEERVKRAEQMHARTADELAKAKTQLREAERKTRTRRLIVFGSWAAKVVETNPQAREAIRILAESSQQAQIPIPQEVMDLFAPPSGDQTPPK